MKIQQAFADKEKRFLKGGLHCHTTRSDGRLTPEEAINCAKEHGYDFLAITDHQVYTMQQYAPETGVLTIPGVELGNDLVKGRGFRCYHTVCLGPTKEDGNGFDHNQRFDWCYAPNAEAYQPYLDEIHQNNNLTILAHPIWSQTSAKYFENLKGNFAMEIWNTGSSIGGDNDAAYWDEILGQGKVCYGVATDDAHSYKEMCKGWVMVKADKDINSILEALKNGEFYSSCGPEIYDFYIEDGKAIIDCSPVKTIRLQSDMHPTRIENDEDGNLTHAEFDIEKFWAGPYDYVRMSVIDKDGKKAWTNPIFLENK